MQFFRVNTLAARLRDGDVNEKEQAWYLAIFYIIFTIFCSTTLAVFTAEDVVLDTWVYLQDALILMAAGLTVLLTYKVNNEGDQQNFVSRYICLSLPAGVKSLVVTFVLSLISLGAAILLLDTEEQYDAFANKGLFFIVYAAEAYYIYLMYRGFKIASGVTPVTSATTTSPA